jgi:hypothetical protein
MNAHVNCLFREVVIRSEQGFGVVAKKEFELVLGYPGGGKVPCGENTAKTCTRSKLMSEAPVVESCEAFCLDVVSQEIENPYPIENNPPKIEPETSSKIISTAS